MARFLSRDEILAVNDVRHVDVDVPEWGGVVRIAMMNGAQRDAFDQMSLKVREDPGKSVRALLVAACAVDEGGKTLFSLSDVEALGRKSAAALVRLFSVAADLNGLSAKEEENLAGNSESDHGGVSHSG